MFIYVEWLPPACNTFLRSLPRLFKSSKEEKKIQKELIFLAENREECNYVM